MCVLLAPLMANTVGGKIIRGKIAVLVSELKILFTLNLFFFLFAFLCSCVSYFVEDYRIAQLENLILDFLSFCVERHTYHIKNYIIHKDLLKRILVLLKSKHQFLALCKFYCFIVYIINITLVMFLKQKYIYIYYFYF